MPPNTSAPREVPETEPNANGDVFPPVSSGLLPAVSMGCRVPHDPAHDFEEAPDGTLQFNREANQWQIRREGHWLEGFDIPMQDDVGTGSAGFTRVPIRGFQINPDFLRNASITLTPGGSSSGIVLNPADPHARITVPLFPEPGRSPQDRVRVNGTGSPTTTLSKKWVYCSARAVDPFRLRGSPRSLWERLLDDD